MPLEPGEFERLLSATCGNELERFALLDGEDLLRWRQIVAGTVVVDQTMQQRPSVAAPRGRSGSCSGVQPTADFKNVNASTQSMCSAA